MWRGCGSNSANGRRRKSHRSRRSRWASGLNRNWRNCSVGRADSSEAPMIDSDEFNEETALAAALALQQVLARRTHRRKYLGQMYTVPGKLGDALKLPGIVAKLQSKVVSRRHKGLADFQFLWDTLSVPTRETVLQEINWYDPKALSWDDVRSNRKPVAVIVPDKKE